MGEIKAGDNCLGKSKRGTNQRPPNTRPKPLGRVATEKEEEGKDEEAIASDLSRRRRRRSSIK